MDEEELRDLRHKSFLSFCRIYGLTKNRRTTTGSSMSLDYDAATEVFPVTRSALEKYWSGKNPIPGTIITIMKLHTGQIVPLHRSFDEMGFSLTLDERT
ncbi:hypothetical protein [Vibrio sp. HN007]|uniref:hypothetical protein n=1 Tax=Vibrio iocasae TaxID=3098914 RepID=UPI0035D4A827